MSVNTLVLAAMIGAFGAFAVAAGAGDDAAAYRHEVEAWQKARQARLQADDGWLTLAGLFWLKPGANRFGSDPAGDIVLPGAGAPAHAGAFFVDADHRVAVAIESGVAATVAGKPVTKAVLRADAGGTVPDILAMGALTMQVIDRQGRLAIRLKDQNSKVRREFRGLHYFPISARYRIVARFIAHPQPVALVVQNVLGLSESQSSPGTAQFEIDGKTFRLDPVIETPGDTKLFFIFRDLTAGHTTYGAGRFLYADPPRDGFVVLDFNKAYSPPCAFTPYATCPLPPAQNRLAIPIEAGEIFEGHH